MAAASAAAAHPSATLLQFNKGEVINEIGKYYLYIFGANAYSENNINKESCDFRVKGVKDNYNNIINMEPNFIKKAQSKITFAKGGCLLFSFKRIK